MKRLLFLLLLALVSLPLFAADSVVVFNEVNYHPGPADTSKEWIELHNQMAIDIDLSVWTLSGSINFTFVEGTIIPGGGYLVVARDPGILQTNYGISNVVGPFDGSLNNSGGVLRLNDRNNRLMDELQYSDGGKWPVAPDGSGATLAKRDGNLPSEAPANWTSSIVSGGTPGRANFPQPRLPQRRTLVPFDGLWRFEASGTDLGTSWHEPGYDDSAWSGRNNATLLAYYPFNGNATAAVGANGSFAGTVTTTTDRNGLAGGALGFGGSQYVSVPGGGGLNAATAGTVSMWVKWSGTQDADCCGSFGAVLARQSNGQFSDDILALNTSNPDTAHLIWRQSGGPAPVLITSTSVVGTNWHHIAVTFSSSGSTLYIDGHSEGTGVGGALNNNPATILSVGAWAGDGAGFSTASIDDFAVWNQPLSATQIAQIASQSKTPTDFSVPESAVYFAGDGQLASNDELRRTALPLGANTFYFRTSFLFSGTQPELQLDLAVDDGAVVYLNGAEAYRHNMPAGAVSYSTLAASVVGNTPIARGIALPATNLFIGINTLAVEVHQAEIADTGMVFAAGLNAITPPQPEIEERSLIALADSWKFEGSGSDLGEDWRASAYNDSAWSSGNAAFFAGAGEIDSLPPERITGVSVTASTEYVADGRLAVHLVDGSGLLGNAHGITPGGTMWLNNGTLAAPNDLNPQLTFDLGGVFPLRSIKVWNYNESLPGRPELLARGVSSADILLGTTTAALSPFRLAQPFAQAPGTATDFSEIIDLGATSARYVRLDKLTNFPGGDFQFVGLSEVQFFQDANLNHTELSLGPVTYYFRRTFNFAGDPSRTELLLNSAADDGAVFYLNGTEVLRHNMPGGSISHSTLASSEVAHATLTGFSSISSAALVRGVNVLAVEVHQAASTGDTDMIFAAELKARITPPDAVSASPGNLVFNEISASGIHPFRMELLNRGDTSLDVSGYVIRQTGTSNDLDYALGPQVIPPGGRLVLDEPLAGFGAIAGAKLFLVLPNGGIADAVEVHERPRARYPDGSGDWLTPNVATFGAPNSAALQNDVVINEIMYHAPSSPEIAPVLATNIILSITNVWRYEQSGTDLGTSWRASSYDDSSWPSGPALLYITTNNLPAPKNTPLTLGPNTFYFRSSFVYTGTPAIVAMTFRHIVDDGAVFYLNGAEILRFNMPAGTIRYTNNASSAIVGIISRGPVNMSLTNLVLGTNVFAVEVHQAAISGNDLAFGAEITATVEAVPRIPFHTDDQQWIELFNRSSNAVDLTGWRLDEAVDFRFASNTFIPPGGYLVAANDPPALLAQFPAISVAGPFANRLSHRGGRVILKDASDNIADVVQYFDDGRWPDAADGGGASLELRDPHADNSAAEAWSASDERGRSGWRTYSYRLTAASSAVGPDGQWHEFVMGLLGPGEVLLDDISVVETPFTTPVQMLQNTNFTSGTNKWRIIGNHHGEVIDDPDLPGNKVLRLVVTGPTEHMSNHGETTFVGNRDVVVGRDYLVSFRAKWISGSRQFHTRLYFNRLARTTLLDVPVLHGTPGSQNTAFTPNIGPTYSDLRHSPVVPAPFEPVTISVRASDPDGVAGLTLWSRADGGNWTSGSMTPDLSGLYTASIPGRAGSAIVQFYVEGIDGLGAKSTFPSGGTNSRALYKVDDGLAATNGLHNIRLVTLTADADQLFQTVNLMSNERIGSTLISDENEIFYDIGLRLKGSEHSRTTTPRLGFEIGFNSEQLFRGIHHTISLDRSESTGFGQREMLVHQMLNHAGGVPTKYHDLVQIIAPRPEYTGSAELQLARYTSVFLDDQFDHGSDGMLFEYELIYQLNSTDTGTPEGNKVPNPDSVMGTTIRNLGDDKEAYRWNFLIKNNEDRDDYSRLIAFCKVMELSGAAYTSQITNVIDVDQWLRSAAVNTLAGCGDSYGGDFAQHNVQFYVRQSDGRVLFFPHDMDAFFDPNRSITANGDIAKLVSTPANARNYYSHLIDIMTTTYNSGYMTRWANLFGRLLPAQDFAGHLAFVSQRAAVVMNQINAAVPIASFAITNNGGNDFSISNNAVTLSGTAPLAVKTIQVNGISYPINWTSTTTWSLAIPLIAGPNSLRVQGVTASGTLLSNAVDTITITNNASGAPLPVVINEWMADNAGPFGFPDPADGLFQDWIELFNPNTNAVNLSGFFLTDNLSLPSKWKFPGNATIAPRGFLLIWADNQTDQNASSTNGDLHAGFQLNNGGEAIGLFSPAGVAQHALVFGSQFQNVSQGLFPDGDTNSLYFMTNWTPRAANTLAGPLKITSLSINAGTLTLFWDTIPLHTYQVEFKDNLDDPVWTPLGQEVSAEGTSASTTDPSPALFHRFYRIIRIQ